MNGRAAQGPPRGRRKIHSMIIRKLIEDVKAIYRNDPAVRNIEFLLYPG